MEKDNKRTLSYWFKEVGEKILKRTSREALEEEFENPQARTALLVVGSISLSLTFLVVALLILGFCLCSCSSALKVGRIEREGLSPGLDVVHSSSPRSVSEENLPHPDTLVVHGDQGEEVLIMKAVKDEDGEMVATDVIDAAVVEAKFRNLAERHGRVELEFRIRIPAGMMDPRWQIRIHPDMFILRDSIPLESVHITGSQYRRSQLRGYERYRKFLSSIVSDTTYFVSERLLDIFIRRNIPALYRFKTDSTYVSEEEFASSFGVTEREAIDHYTRKIALRRNERKSLRRDYYFRKWVPAPIMTDSIRLDTVLVDSNGDFIYNYTQTLRTRPSLRKVEIKLRGEILESAAVLYRIPQTEPITYYISSLSTLVDDTPRYLKRIIGRRVEERTACLLEFVQGSSKLEEGLGNNPDEIARIEGNLASLLRNTEFGLDSIVVTASCSPEGSYSLNERLSQERSEEVSRYFGRFISEYRDSLKRETGTVYDLSGVGTETVPHISFVSRSEAENWRGLDVLIGRDETLSFDEKKDYLDILEAFGGDDPKTLDRREEELGKRPYYIYLREKIYPRLRVVRFDFHLHRKGMVQDTLETTTLDEQYMEGVQAIRDHEYEKALSLLRPYGDYNTAVAYTSLDYNESALAILRDLEKRARVDYLLALIYGRKGEDALAMEHYIDACRKDPSLVHRGNLDPEISELVSRYSLDMETLLDR